MGERSTREGSASELASYKWRPDEAVSLGIAACAAAGIELDVDLRLVALACRYSSGTTKTPDTSTTQDPSGEYAVDAHDRAMIRCAHASAAHHLQNRERH